MAILGLSKDNYVLFYFPPFSERKISVKNIAHSIL